MRRTRTSTSCSIGSIQSIFKKFKIAWGYSFNNKIAKNFEDVLALWHASLADFSDAVVLRAAQAAIDECKYLPAIAEYRKLCREVTPKVMATILSAPDVEQPPPEWWIQNMELTRIVKEIHFPNKHWKEPVNEEMVRVISTSPAIESFMSRFRGTVAYEVAEIVNVYKRQVDCPSKMDVPGIKRAIQIANADLMKAAHARNLQ